ncbi:hypothetical protein EGW08_020426 [Elysia chlorotica]|uniref:Uncharacterized protein n=1 Tax=Elysia chlorotica TaxID=188477 RepID=A0A3S0Z8J0_ELYCH|nr:hypothetical protein EGW08_020426 [Elysia chlorotica]
MRTTFCVNIFTIQSHSMKKKTLKMRNAYIEYTWLLFFFFFFFSVLFTHINHTSITYDKNLSFKNKQKSASTAHIVFTFCNSSFKYHDFYTSSLYMLKVVIY